MQSVDFPCPITGPCRGYLALIGATPSWPTVEPSRCTSLPRLSRIMNIDSGRAIGEDGGREGVTRWGGRHA